MPSSRLIVDVAGTLYGTTLGSNYSDYGVIYKLTPDTDRSKWKLSVLHRFNESRRYQDGFSSEGGLTYAGEASGLPYDGVSPLFGMTVLGGNSLMGIVYRLSPKAGDTGWSYKIIHDFCTDENCMDGEFPFGNLIVDAQQNLYGTTSAGGADGYSGTVFKLSPSAKKTVWAETVLYNFCPIQGCSDGMEPSSEVLMDATGNLFGTTSRGGATCDDQYGCGVAFKLTPSGETWKQKVLHTFCALPGCQDGSQPFGGMTLDAAGNLYGTTAYGGGNNIDQNQLGGGTVFQISGRHRVLHRFCSQPNCADGARPTDSLLSDGAGKLYGTTSLGGKYGQGTVFELTP